MGFNSGFKGLRKLGNITAVVRVEKMSEGSGADAIGNK